MMRTPCRERRRIDGSSSSAATGTKPARGFAAHLAQGGGPGLARADDDHAQPGSLFLIAVEGEQARLEADCSHQSCREQRTHDQDRQRHLARLAPAEGSDQDHAGRTAGDNEPAGLVDAGMSPRTPVVSERPRGEEMRSARDRKEDREVPPPLGGYAPVEADEHQEGVAGCNQTQVEEGEW